MRIERAVLLAHDFHRAKRPIVGRVRAHLIVQVFFAEKPNLRLGVAGEPSRKDVGILIGAIDAAVLVVTDARVAPCRHLTIAQIADEKDKSRWNIPCVVSRLDIILYLGFKHAGYRCRDDDRRHPHQDFPVDPRLKIVFKRRISNDQNLRAIGSIPLLDIEGGFLR